MIQCSIYGRSFQREGGQNAVVAKISGIKMLERIQKKTRETFLRISQKNNEVQSLMA